MIDNNVGVPKNGSVDTHSLPPVDVPQTDWSTHPILSRGVLNVGGDGFDWPAATPVQLEQLRDISVFYDGSDLVARLASQFNFDHFVNATFYEQNEVPSIGRIDDAQRFYTRVTDNGFHVVGVFTAVTINGCRRYFQWLTSTWVEIGQSGFLYVRDDPDTHFSEVDEQQLEHYQPGATTTRVPMPSEIWSMEHFEAHFGSMDADVSVMPDEAFAVENDPIVAITTFEPDQEPTHMSIFAPHFSVVPAPAPTAEMISDSVAPPVEITVTEIGAPASVAAHRAEEPATVSSAAQAGTEPVAPSIEEITVINNTPASGSSALSAEDAKAQQSIASALATIAHRGQLDRVGAAYIDHPARVAERFDWRVEPIQHAAAWLHSVMEDSDISQRDLLEAGIRSEIVEIVTLLTRRSDVSDGDFFAAINANPIARAVKLADIADNSAPWRVRRLDSATQTEFSAKHAAARAALGVAPGD